MEDVVLNAVCWELEQTAFPHQYDISSLRLHTSYDGGASLESWGTVYWGSWYVCKFRYMPDGRVNLTDWAERFRS